MKILIVRKGYGNKCNRALYDKVFITDKYTLSAYQIKQIFSGNYKIMEYQRVIEVEDDDVKTEVYEYEVNEPKETIDGKVDELNMVGVYPARVEFLRDEYDMTNSNYITRSIIGSTYTQQIDVFDKLIMIKEFAAIANKVYYLHNNKRTELKMNIQLGKEYRVNNIHTQISIETGYSELYRLVKRLTPRHEAEDNRYTYFGHDAKMIGDYNPIKLTVDYYDVYKFKQWSTIDDKYIILYKGSNKPIKFGYDTYHVVPTKSEDGNKTKYHLYSSQGKLQISHKTNWRWLLDNKDDSDIIDYYVDGVHCTMTIRVIKAIKRLFGITNRISCDELHIMAMTCTKHIEDYIFNYNDKDAVLASHNTLVDWLASYGKTVEYRYIVFEKTASEERCYEDWADIDEDFQEYVDDHYVNYNMVLIDVSLSDAYKLKLEEQDYGIITVLV